MAEKRVSRSIVVDAPAERLFALVADPARHADFDGSGTVRGSESGSGRLAMGSEFGMSMRLGVPYRMGNRVVEFEEGRHIAWRTAGPHRWGWTFEPEEDGRTRVTETFDYSLVPFPMAWAFIVLGIPGRNARAIEDSLLRFRSLAEEEHRG
ncbi:SRPBCC family protein [Nocardiopsis coralliicola]